MTETIVKRQRADPGQVYDVLVGTTTITFTDGVTEADSAAITFDPIHSEAPKVLLSVEKVVETNAPTRGTFSVEMKAGTTVASTGMTLTGFTVDPNGATKSVVFTIRYELIGLIQN